MRSLCACREVKVGYYLLGRSNGHASHESQCSWLGCLRGASMKRVPGAGSSDVPCACSLCPEPTAPQASHLHLCLKGHRTAIRD